MSESFDIVNTGTADRTAPATPKNVPHRGGAVNPTAEALRAKFGAAVRRVDVVWGETTAVVDAASVAEMVRWLRDDDGQRYDYLVDITAVEHRDLEMPLEVVWHVRSLPFRRFLRLKAPIAKGSALAVPSVWGVHKSADWLERECWDMFGVHFEGHPDLRRILMWESYKEGHPLRKSFPLRGRFSRAEQLRQILTQNVEARYSMEELTVVDAFSDLPQDMRARLGSGERTGE